MDLATIEAACAELASWPNPEPIKPPFFVRVRKRKLKGAEGEWRVYRHGPIPTAAMSFDLVRSVRVNGTPRHKVLLGLGSQKDHEREMSLWLLAIRRMERHGLDADRRQLVADEMIRKGARRPTVEQCEKTPILHGETSWAKFKPEIVALVAEA